MKRHSKFPVAIALLAVLLGIILVWVAWIVQRAHREYALLVDPKTVRVDTIKQRMILKSSPPQGMRAYPYLADALDILVDGDLTLWGTEAGLGVSRGSEVALFDPTGGLPAGGVLSLASVGGNVFALNPNGLLRFSWPAQASVASLAVEFFKPSGALLVAMAATQDRLWALDSTGRLLQFDGKFFGEAAKVAETGGARLALLGEDAAVALPSGRITLVSGVGRAAGARDLWPAGEPTSGVTALAGGENELLVGTPTGLFRLGRDGVPFRLADAAVSAVCRWRGRVWYGGPDGRVADAGGEGSLDLDAAVNACRADGENLLLATAAGPYATDGGAARPLVPAAPLAPVGEAYVTALLAAPDGDILVGTLNRGLWRLDPDRPPATTAGLGSYGVNQIVTTADGYLVATTNGLFALDGNLAVRRRWTERDGLPHRYVAAVVPDAGGIAVATSAGLAYLAANGARAIDAFHGLAGNHLYCLVAHAGGLATGGLAGLTLVGPPPDIAVLRAVNAADGLPHNWVNALQSDGERLFVGTYGGGLVVVTGEERPRAVPGTAGMAVNPNTALRYGERVMFGTLGHGLLVSRDGRTWRSFAGPLLSPNVTALAAAPDALWLGTDRGLQSIAWPLLDASE